MSPAASLCFVFCGSALVAQGLAGSAGGGGPIICLLGSLAGGIGGMALFGYLTGIAGTYAWGESSLTSSSTSISLTTAAANAA